MKKLPYIVLFSLWEDEPSNDVQKVVDKIAEFVAGLGLKGYHNVDWSMGGYWESGQPMVRHKSISLWFEEVSDWEAANRQMETNDHFVMKVPKSERAVNRVRIYQRKKKED